MSVQPPSAAPDILACVSCLVLRQLVECVARSCASPLLLDRSDCHTLSRHKCCGCLHVGLGRSTMMASNVAAKSFVSWTFAGATTIAKGPPSPSVRTLRFVPFFARSVGFGPIAPPQTGLCPSRHQPLAISIGYLAVRRTLRPGVLRPFQTIQSRTNAENTDELCCHHHTRAGCDSIGNSYAIEK